MKQFNVINRLCLINGKLMCKKPSKRSYQKAHYKQGDLDGACGAYSISMVLNMLGVFEADDLYSDKEYDRRTAEWKLIKALNDNGLYRDGLTSCTIKTILTENYSKYVDVQCINKDYDIIDTVKKWIDSNIPVILGISYDSKRGHWIVAVGYALDDDCELTDILTLDPGNDSPKYSLWNGILNVKKEPNKKYGYRYNTSDSRMIDLDEAILISRNR